jgi:hypothetical protein
VEETVYEGAIATVIDAELKLVSTHLNAMHLKKDHDHDGHNPMSCPRKTRCYHCDSGIIRRSAFCLQHGRLVPADDIGGSSAQRWAASLRHPAQ